MPRPYPASRKEDYAMSSLLHLTRRNLVKLGFASAAAAPLAEVLTSSALAQDAGADAGTLRAGGGRAETQLFPGKALPGGGQLEIRLSQSIYTNDPDQLEVAQRMKPFNL